MTVLLLVAAAGAYATLSWAGSSTDDSPSPSAAPSTSSTSSDAPSTKQRQPLVLAISVDGLNPDALTTLGRTGAPAFWRLIDEGASTMNARTSYEVTVTLPNHTGMLTGRPQAGGSGTSVTFNNDNGGTLESTHGDYVASMFDVAHDHGIRTALFAEKDKFAFLIRSWDGKNGAPDTEGRDDGKDKIDAGRIGPPAQLVPAVTDALTSTPNGLVFLHIAAPDAAGHASGWLGEQYLQGVRDADAEVAAILKTLDADRGLRARTTILLTADHGGPSGQRRHNQADLLANHRIPFIAWGKGVRRGADLYELNDRRRDPGTARPGYEGPQPIRNLDLANTALHLLDLPSIPGAPTSDLDPVELR